MLKKKMFAKKKDKWPTNKKKILYCKRSGKR
jgi:hypothetical protein